MPGNGKKYMAYSIYSHYNFGLRSQSEKILQLFAGMNKNPALQDSPPAAGRLSDILPYRRSAVSMVLCNGKINAYRYFP